MVPASVGPGLVAHAGTFPPESEAVKQHGSLYALGPRARAADGWRRVALAQALVKRGRTQAAQRCPPAHMSPPGHFS